MKERATLVLSEEQIKNILASYYLSNIDLKTNEQIIKSLRLDYKIITKKTGMNIDFILTYEKKIESLDVDINKEFVVSIEDLNNIINEKFAEEGYEIDSLEEHLRSESNPAERTGVSDFKYIKYNLKKNEKVKIKKKGWR